MLISGRTLTIAATILLASGCATNDTDTEQETLGTTSSAITVRAAHRKLCGVWDNDGPENNYLEFPNGTRAYSFGTNSIARLVLRKDGYGTQFVARAAAERPNCVSPAGHLACTPEEASAAFYSALSFNYRYTVTPSESDRRTGALSFAIDSSTYPNFVGQTVPRTYTLSNDDEKLELLAPGPNGATVHLKLTKVGPCNTVLDLD